MSNWMPAPSRGKASGDGGVYVKPPAGNQPAVLVAIIDLGTQRQTGFNGKPDYWQRRIYFVFELVTKPKDDGTGNHVIATDITFSLNEKATLTAWIASWTGKPVAPGQTFDISTLLGKTCLLNVVDEPGKKDPTKVYAKIKGLAAPFDGMPAYKPTHQPFSWNIADAVPGAVPAIPPWVPYLYGSSIPDVIGQSQELKGKFPATQTAKPAAAPPPPLPSQSMASTTPPTPPTPPGYLEELFYVANQAPFAADRAYTRKEIMDWLPTSGKLPQDVQLNKNGDPTWQTAMAYGFTGTPF